MANPEPPAPPSTPETEPPAPGLDVAAIAARCNAATPGPWRDTWEEFAAQTDHHEGGVVQQVVETGPDGDDLPFPVVGLVWYDGPQLCTTKEDATFIAHARTDVPALLAALRAAEQEREAAVLAERERCADRVEAFFLQVDESLLELLGKEDSPTKRALLVEHIETTRTTRGAVSNVIRRIDPTSGASHAD